MSARPNAVDFPHVTRASGPSWVAVEGPSCAGKTTLSQRLLGELTDVRTYHVVCYADHVGGGRFLPRPVPDSVAEDQQALQVLLAIEAERTAGARAAASDLVLMDRSVYTLLAHRHAIQRMTGLACLAPAERVVAASTAPAWPDLVLYLDVTQQAVHDRNGGKFPADSIFIDAEFNTGFRDYFIRASRRNARIAWLDATLDPAELAATAQLQIRELLRSRNV